MRTLLLIVGIAWATGAQAADPNVGEVALQAAETHEAHCADTRGNDIAVLGEALAQVSTRLQEVNTAFESTHDASLLFWRGLLSLCLDRDDLGAADLQAFVETVGDQPAYAQQVQDAERRLRRVQVRSIRRSSGGPAPGGLALGVGLGAGAGAFAGLSGWQALELRTTTDNLTLGRLNRDEIDAAYLEGPRIADRANAFLGTSVGLGIGSIAAAVITGVTARSGGRSLARGAPPPVVVVTPSPGGVQVQFGGTW